MSDYYCQMDIVEAGIWSVFDRRTCCGRPAPFHIVVWIDREIRAIDWDEHAVDDNF